MFGRNDVPPIGELSAIACGHVLNVLGHPKGEVVLVQDLRVGLPELSELLHELAVAKHSIGVVGRIVDDPKTELRGGSADAQPDDKQDCKDFLFHRVFSFREVENLSGRR